MRLSEKQRSVAVQWWIDKLVNPPIADGGFDFETFLCVNVARDMVNKVTKLTENHLQISKFKELLEALIMYQDETLVLWTDYKPLELLLDAAEKSGIPLNLFPIKTAMKFKDNGIQVKIGYGKPFNEIMGKDKENM